jgi:hypothetical protein
MGDAAYEAAPREQVDARSRMTARVTTTVVLPPEALTIVAPQPEMISQVTVEHVLGVPSRTYLELLRERDCPVAVTSVGKLRLVDRSLFRGWLEARGKTNRAAAATKMPSPEDDDLLSVDEQTRLGIKLSPTVAKGRR